MSDVLPALCDEVASARAAGRTLRIRGGDTRDFYGNPYVADEPIAWLDMSRWRGVVAYEPSELVITARAGTPLAEIEATLEARDQMLAFEPPRFGATDTVGGCIATALAGPRRMAAGTVADFVLGTRMLNAEGHVLHFGGEVMKNVAGYDMSRLLTGSLGILGALTEVSLKVLPKPRQEVTRELQLDEATALERCLGWRARSLPVTATAWEAGADGATGCLRVRLSGNASAVRLGSAEIGGGTMDDATASAWWLSLRDQTHAFFAQRPLWRLSVPPRTPALVLGPTLHEWGGTLRWLAGPQDASALRNHVQELGGSACLYHRGDVPAEVPGFHPLSPALARIHQRLKHEFDPTGVFNRHRMYTEL